MILFKAIPVLDVGEPWYSYPEQVVGYDSFTWVDRYREAGQVEIVGPRSAGLDEQLPLGTLVSHTRSLGWCMIESGGFDLTEEGEEKFVARGRSLDGWLSYRVVGEFETGTTTPDYENGPPQHILSSGETWNQAKELIDTHALGGQMDYLLCQVIHGITNDLIFPSPTLTAKALERRPVYEVLQDLLKIQDLGIKVVRGLSSRGDLAFEPSGAAAADHITYLLIHAGVDRTDQIAFSFARGDLTDVSALASNELNYNSTSVVGSYAAHRYTAPGASKYWRRTQIVDASEIDKQWTPPNSYAPQEAMLQELAARAVAINNGFRLTDAKVGTNSPYAYGIDYDIGDIVMLEGGMHILEPRRVTEHTTVVTREEVQEIPTFSELGA